MAYRHAASRATKDRRRAAWMQEYERALVSSFPELRGNVDWDTATYLFLEGLSALAAVSGATAPDRLPDGSARPVPPAPSAAAQQGHADFINSQY